MAPTYWFSPKSHGYGASPKNWKGWAAIAAFTLVTMGLTYIFFIVLRPAGGEPRPALLALWAVVVAALTYGFVRLTRAKTDGDWRWRWGRGPFANLPKPGSPK